MSYLEEGSCDEEEEYHSILEGEKGSKEPNEAPEQERVHNSPTAPGVRSRDLSPSNSVNTSNTNAVNSGKGSPTSQNFVPSILVTNTMAGDDI